MCSSGSPSLSTATLLRKNAGHEQNCVILSFSLALSRKALPCVFPAELFLWKTIRLKLAQYPRSSERFFLIEPSRWLFSKHPLLLFFLSPLLLSLAVSFTHTRSLFPSHAVISHCEDNVRSEHLFLTEHAANAVTVCVVPVRTNPWFPEVCWAQTAGQLHTHTHTFIWQTSDRLTLFASR